MANRKQPLRLIRRGRFLSPSERRRYRLYRIRTGRVFAADDGDAGIAIVAIAYGIRLITLPFAIVADWIAEPVLRRLDRSDTWWVVEVRFHEWDAQFVRVAEAQSEADARERLARIESA
jgi:hypothetical protein